MSSRRTLAGMDPARSIAVTRLLFAPEKPTKRSLAIGGDTHMRATKRAPGRAISEPASNARKSPTAGGTKNDAVPGRSRNPPQLALRRSG